MIGNKPITRVIDGLRYSELNATLIADDQFDRKNHSDLATYLYRTQKGNFFRIEKKGLIEEDSYGELCPICEQEAMFIFEIMPFQYVPFEEVFPSVTVTDA